MIRLSSFARGSKLISDTSTLICPRFEADLYLLILLSSSTRGFGFFWNWFSAPLSVRGLEFFWKMILLSSSARGSKLISDTSILVRPRFKADLYLLICSLDWTYTGLPMLLHIPACLDLPSTASFSFFHHTSGLTLELPVLFIFSLFLFSLA